MKESIVAMQLRLREATHLKLKVIARAEMRSLNAQIEYLLQKSIEEYEAAHGPLAVTEEEA